MPDSTQDTSGASLASATRTQSAGVPSIAQRPASFFITRIGPSVVTRWPQPERCVCGATQVSAPCVAATSARAAKPGASMPSSFVRSNFITDNLLDYHHTRSMMEEKMPHPWVLAEQTHALVRSQKWE